MPMTPLTYFRYVVYLVWCLLEIPYFPYDVGNL